MEIFPSLFAADAQKMASYIHQLDPYCPGYHLDIMDNVFVPNSMGSLDLITKVLDTTTKKIWIHLMVKEAESWIAQITAPPGTIISFHVEAQNNKKKLIEQILAKNWKPSMAVNPKTPIEEIFVLTKDLYQIVVMSVEPGFAGQPFLTSTYEKLDKLVGHRMTSKQNFMIAVDGGINETNIRQLAERGADQCAVASAIFSSSKPVEVLQWMSRV